MNVRIQQGEEDGERYTDIKLIDFHRRACPILIMPDGEGIQIVSDGMPEMEFKRGILYLLVKEER